MVRCVKKESGKEKYVSISLETQDASREVSFDDPLQFTILSP